MTPVLVMASLFGVLPIPGYSAQTYDNDYMMLEVTKMTTLRSDYYAKSSVLSTLEENTILFRKREPLINPEMYGTNTFTPPKAAATLEKVAVDWAKSGVKFKPEQGDYYNGIASGDFPYINRANLMGKQKAVSRIDILLYINTLTREVFQWFIYTLHEFDARIIK